MGLLLSVLVVCVGVLEVIACVRHFQDGYLPLWTPHCAVTSGFAITHDRWRKLPSFDYAKNDDEKHFEDLTGAKNSAVALRLQDDGVRSVDNFGKTLRCAASLQDDQEVVSEIHLQESQTTFVAQNISDNEHEDKNINFTSDIHKQTVIDVFQSDIYNNNLVQTEHNLEADITTFHTQDSTLTSDQDIQTQYEAPGKEAELIQQPPEVIPDDSLKYVEEHEDDDTYETTVVGAIHHEEATTHITKDHTSESDSRLELQTSPSDADVIRSEEIETQPQETPDSGVKSEETPEELIETLKKTPSPVRISPPISTPPLTPKKSKADISWPTFFPGAPVIKRPSVSFATPEALLAGEDPDPHPRNDEEDRPATPPPIIKRSKENTPVQSDVESRSVSSESLGEAVDQEEEDNEEENLFSGIREKSPTSIISGNDFSKKELELQRRKSYKLKRFNSAVETVSRDEQTEDRSFSEDKKGVSHAVKSREPKRRFKKPVKATSFEDAMLRDIRDADVIDGGTTLKLGKEVKFVDEPTVVVEEEEILLEQEIQTPQEESNIKTDEGLTVSFGQVESEPETLMVHEKEKQYEKNDFTEQKKQMTDKQSIFDEAEDIEESHDERHEEAPNEEQISTGTKPVDENQDITEKVHQIKEERVLYQATEAESGGQGNKEDEVHEQVITEKIMGMQDASQIHSKAVEAKSTELTAKLDSKQSEETDGMLASKEMEELVDNSEIHSMSTEAKPSDETATKFESKELKDKQTSKEDEQEQEEEFEEWEEEEIMLDISEVPFKAVELNRSNEISITSDTRQNEKKLQSKQVAAEEEIEEEEEEEDEEEHAIVLDNSKIHSKAIEVNSGNEISAKLYTRRDEETGQTKQVAAEEEEELEEEEEELEEEDQAVVLDESKVHSKSMEIKSSEAICLKTDDKEGEPKRDDAEEEEVEEEEQAVVVEGNSAVHSKAMETKSSDQMSSKTLSEQDAKEGETKQADAEEEEMEEEEEKVVMVDNSEVHSKAMETKSSDEISINTDSKQDDRKDESKRADAEKEEVEEEEEEQVVMVDSSKVHSKAMETKSSDEISIKTASKQDDKTDETKRAGAEKEEVEEEEEQQSVMVDNSEVHSKAMETKSSVEISTKAKQDVEKVVIDTSKVHSKPAETESSVETTTKVLVKQDKEEEQALAKKQSDVQQKGLTREEKASAMQQSDEQQKGLTREEKTSAMKESGEAQQERQSTGVRFAEPERATRVVEGDQESDEAQQERQSTRVRFAEPERTTRVVEGDQESGEAQQERQSTGVRFAEPERTTRVVEGDEEEEEDSSSYTYSDSTQQKTPPKEAFWME